MRNSNYINISILIVAMMIGACGQDPWEVPDAGQFGASGECGAWYPAASTSGDGQEAAYAVEQGKVFPCAVWESAKLNNENTFINVGDEYLKAKHGITDKRGMVIVVSAQDCPNCEELIGSIKDRVADFDAAGAFAVGVAFTSSSDPSVDLSLDEAAALLYGLDGWPMEWPITNDIEGYVRGIQAEFPQLIVISMSDMNIHSLLPGAFGSNGYADADELLDTIASFPDVAPAEE